MDQALRDAKANARLNHRMETAHDGISGNTVGHDLRLPFALQAAGIGARRTDARWGLGRDNLYHRQRPLGRKPTHNNATGSAVGAEANGLAFLRQKPSGLHEV